MKRVSNGKKLERSFRAGCYSNPYFRKTINGKSQNGPFVQEVIHFLTLKECINGKKNDSSEQIVIQIRTLERLLMEKSQNGPFAQEVIHFLTLEGFINGKKFERSFR